MTYTYKDYHWIISYEVEPTESYYFAKCLELKGCMTDAPTLAELEENMEEATELFLEVMKDTGKEIPVPYSSKQISELTHTTVA